MPPNNPMTEGEALAVLDADAIASSLVDWMLTKAMPNGDLLHASVACDYAGMANFKRALSKQLRAALREQPEARGVVDGAVAGLRVLRTILAKENLAGVDVADQLIADLTAAQQPVQEGGGEVCPRCKGAGEYEGFARHASGDPQDEYAATVQCEPCEGTGEVAAPPSAPFGVEGLVGAQGFLDWNRSQAKPPVRIGQEYAVYEAALAQQPAQAAPGDAVDADFFRWLNEHPANVQTMADLLRADQYVNLRRACEAIVPNDRRLSATPPGDDAAGGGHG